MWNLLVPQAHAQGVDIRDTFPPADNFNTVGTLIDVLLPNIFTVAGIVAFVIVVVAGFRFMRHAGSMEGEKAAQSKGALTSAIVGLIIVVTSYFLIKLISTIIGYDILNPSI